jgi:hypothetical protein
VKRLLSILLLLSLLLSNIGFVRIGDNCCSKTISALMQPILISNCCCEADLETDKSCCSSAGSFEKLNADFDKLENAKAKHCVNTFLEKSLLPVTFNEPCFSAQAIGICFQKNLQKKPPKACYLKLYKLFNKLILFA